VCGWLFPSTAQSVQEERLVSTMPGNSEGEPRQDGSSTQPLDIVGRTQIKEPSSLTFLPGDDHRVIVAGREEVEVVDLKSGCSVCKLAQVSESTFVQFFPRVF
jgi:hypothetical protein